jgi:hypothetical protein
MVRTLALYGALGAFAVAAVAAVFGSPQLSLAAGFVGLFLLTAAQLDARR